MNLFFNPLYNALLRFVEKIFNFSKNIFLVLKKFEKRRLTCFFEFLTKYNLFSFDELCLFYTIFGFPQRKFSRLVN